MANNGASRIARLERAEAHLQRSKTAQPEFVVYDPATGPPPATEPCRARVLIPDNGRGEFSAETSAGSKSNNERGA